MAAVHDDPCYDPGADPVQALIDQAERAVNAGRAIHADVSRINREAADPHNRLDPAWTPRCRRVMAAWEVDADRPRWLAERRHGSAEATGNPADNTWRLTASELAAVVGLAPPAHASAFSLYHEKLTGESTFHGNDRTDLGLYLEAHTAARFAATQPDLMVGPGGLYVSTAWPWLGATFDRIAYDILWDDSEHNTGCCVVPAEGGGYTDPSPDCCGAYGPREVYVPHAPVQLKSWGGSRDEFGPDGSPVMPVYFRVQLLVEMAVLGTSQGYLPVLWLPDGKLTTLAIERDAAAERDIAALVQAGEQFIGTLDQELPPEVDWSPSTAATLRRLHPGLTDREVRVPVKLAARRVAARKALKAAERRAAQVDNELRQLMGDARVAVARTKDGGLDKVVSRSVYPVPAHSVRACTVDKFSPGRWGR